MLVYPLNDAKRACNALDRDFVFLPKEKNISIKQSGTIGLKRANQILASLKECSLFFNWHCNDNNRKVVEILNQLKLRRGGHVADSQEKE